MKHTFKLSLLCSAILLAGCGDDTSSSGTSDTVSLNQQYKRCLIAIRRLALPYKARTLTSQHLLTC